MVQYSFPKYDAAVTPDNFCPAPRAWDDDGIYRSKVQAPLHHLAAGLNQARAVPPFAFAILTAAVYSSGPSQVGVHGCCCCRFTDEIDLGLYKVPGCPEWSDP